MPLNSTRFTLNGAFWLSFVNIYKIKFDAGNLIWNPTVGHTVYGDVSGVSVIRRPEVSILPTLTPSGPLAPTSPYTPASPWQKETITTVTRAFMGLQHK